METLADLSLIVLVLLGMLLILIVLLQRGRGGGLAGALGGAGGQSAFGTKSGDVFTWVTAGLAAAWFLLSGVSGCLARDTSGALANQADEGRVELEEDQSIADEAADFELSEPAPAAPVEGFDADEFDFDGPGDDQMDAAEENPVLGLPEAESDNVDAATPASSDEDTMDADEPETEAADTSDEKPADVVEETAAPESTEDDE